jgi:hypothetical protein
LVLEECLLKKIRFDFVKNTFEKKFPKNSLARTFTEKIDKFLLNKFF